MTENLSTIAERLAPLLRPCDEYTEESEYNCIDDPTAMGMICLPCTLRGLMEVLDAARRTHEATVFIPGDPDAFYMEDAHLGEVLRRLP